MRLARKDPYEATPICRCRVLYLGSAVPQVTKDGLQGIQEPLRELYPAEGAVSAKGIDSWLSVWSNGLLLENVDENQKKVTRFFPIECLHYCAAVRYVVVSGESGPPVPRFLPLDSPFARNPSISHPPLFACILRRTTGIKVLECHAFICKRETPANALVRCCFHAYADSMYAKSLEGGGGNASQEGSLYGGGRATEEVAIEVDYTGDLSSANSEILPASVRSSPTDEGPSTSHRRADDEMSIYNGDENHKVWAGPTKPETEVIYADYGTSTLRSARSTSSIYGTAGHSKSSRPRQMIMPSVAPPPPNTDTYKDDRKGKRDPRYKGRDDDEMSRMSNGRPSSHHMNGSLMRGANGYHQPQQKSKGKIPRMFNSLSDRKKGGKRPPPPFVVSPHGAPVPMGPPMNGPPPPNMMPPSHMPPPPPHMIPGPHGPMLPPQMAGGPPVMVGPYGPVPSPYVRRPHSRAAEEPIYMPSSRPLSPTASYQPGHFPHEQYLLQQYASTGRPKHKKKKKRGKGKDETDEDIYGRKGHLNERAFSHSIREEHRSQSFASLVGLDDSQLTKKDKEMMQMVADLDLSGDDIERVEVRPGVYRGPRSEISGTINSRMSRR
ncbi:UNVERIFIED_CONTAM: hypothetical protein GTU68_058669 [Idotea baltica]|nr:hypothetical protein [Idotea baltica]